MADTPVDEAVKSAGDAVVGGVVGATIIAPVVTGTAAAIGLAVAPWLVLPVLGGSILTGWWGARKIRKGMQ